MPFMNLRNNTNNTQRRQPVEYADPTEGLDIAGVVTPPKASQEAKAQSGRKKGLSENRQTSGPLKKMTALQMAQELLGEDVAGSNAGVNLDLGLEEHLLSTVRANVCSTIGVKYSLGVVYVTSVMPSGVRLVEFPDYSPEMYMEFCERVLDLNRKEMYNCSRSKNIHGVKTRIYAVMPPLSQEPNITISTTKQPPAVLDKQTISDEMFDDIVHSNFIIVGPSGSGKTYLFNYLLSKYIRDNERIALIEEFMELIPPNELVTTLTCPPPKPNEKSLLKFMTEQANLMRLDATYIGEIKSGEAWPFVVQAASGTRVGCTIHGENAQQALSRLRALCLLETDNADAVNEFISKSIKYVIVMKNKNIEKIEALTGTCQHNIFGLEEVSS